MTADDVWHNEIGCYCEQRGAGVTSDTAARIEGGKEMVAILREPTKPETKIGWWFMRRFRRAEVARRTARNKVMEEAYLAACQFDLPELRAALDAYSELP